MRCEVHGKPDVSVRPSAELLPVQPYPRVRHGAIELKRDAAALDAGRQREMLAVPAHAEVRQPAGVRVVAAIERTLDRPVMGQIERAPTRVGIVGALGAIARVPVEEPALAKADPPRVVDVDRPWLGGGPRGRWNH
jgi:hypothetical protein